MGKPYTDIGQYERALQDYDEAIRLDPRTGCPSLQQQGQVALGEEELAERNFAKAKELRFE